jgi:hypothetical protein
MTSCLFSGPRLTSCGGGTPGFGPRCTEPNPHRTRAAVRVSPSRRLPRDSEYAPERGAVHAGASACTDAYRSRSCSVKVNFRRDQRHRPRENRCDTAMATIHS